MAELWTSALPWAPHQKGLAAWAARVGGWTAGDPDWPSALALLAGAEDEGHTALDWNQAPALWDRLFARDDAPAPPFALPPPELWPATLWENGWLHRGPLVQNVRQAGLERRLFDALSPRAGNAPGQGQDDAVARAGKAGLLLLVGGPGTGKTTTLRRLVARWAELRPGLRTAVAAPTGRAAARARESFASGGAAPECLTIHRLLGLRPGLGEAWHGPHRPLPFDLVIVDEASMLDLKTAVALVEALAPDSALVLVGDPGQLPSVEAGSVLADLLSHPRFAGSTVRLTQRFRLDAESRSLARVFDLLQAAPDDPDAVLSELRALSGAPDFRWIETEADPAPDALRAWGTAHESTLDDLGRRILLSPVHQGPGGTLALGALVEKQRGRPVAPVSEGTPWMVGRNLPHLELSNGDRGLVVRAEGRLWFVMPERPHKRLPFSLVAEAGTPAWAVTVHKSQGSEFDRVVLVLPPRSGLVRELLYTAVTRARTSAVLVASAASVRAALLQSARRVSGFSLLGSQ